MFRRTRALVSTAAVLVCSLTGIAAPGCTVTYGATAPSLPPEACPLQQRGPVPQTRTAGTLGPVPLPLASPEYAPGQVIVKLKPGAKLDESKLCGAGYLASVPAFKGLAAKHRIRNARQVFRSLDPEKVKKRFVQRAKRARKDAVPPDLSTVYTLVLEDSQAPILQICERLRQEPDVEFAEPNYVARIQMVPNDPYYSSSGSWGQAYDDLWGIKKINCEPAWDVSLGDGVVVAVIDTGLDYNHEDIISNVWVNTAEDINGNGRFDNWPSTEQQGGVYGDLDGVDNDSNGKIDDVMGWDFCTYGGNVPDNNPMDDMGHGTHVSGTIAAVGNNGVGVIGVAPHAKIMPVKGLNYQGNGYVTDLAVCITYAADNGADILNNSWQGYGSYSLKAAVDHAVSLGCVVFASAGNSSLPLKHDDLYSPAQYDNVIAVSATDCFDCKASFSNWGAKCDFAAPGVDVLSLRAANTDLYLGSSGYTPGQNFVPAYDPNAKYYRASGTSMSCPHASGLSALLLSAHPEYSMTQVRKAMRLTTDTVSSPLYFIGTGRLSASAALAADPPTSSMADLSYPIEDGYLHNSEQILGTATDAGYMLDLGATAYPSSWTRVASGGPVSNGTLGTFDAAGVSDGYYAFRLSVGDAVDFGTFFYDEHLMPGFPCRSLHGLNPPVVADLENDGEDEVIFTGIISLDVAEKEGRSAPGFPVNTRWGNGTPWLLVNQSPAVGDLNNDGRKEIFVIGQYDLNEHTNVEAQLFSSTGTLLWKRSYPDEQCYGMAPPMVADLNGDGQNEIITCSAGKSPGTTGLVVRALSGAGSVLWTSRLGSVGMIQNGAVGDLTGDGLLEIVLGVSLDLTGDGWNDAGRLWVLDATGNELFQAAPEPAGSACGALTLADLDGDHQLDIVYAPWTFPSGGRVYAFDCQGNQFWSSQPVAGPIFGLTPADLNHDGRLELVVRCYGLNDTSSSLPNKLNIMDDNGLLLSSWDDLQIGWVGLGAGRTNSLAADYDGDGAIDVIGSGGAWTAGGSMLTGFPKKTYRHYWGVGGGWCSGALAKLSSAGQMSLLGFGNDWMGNAADLFAWESPVVYDHLATEWAMFAHDARNTNCYIAPSLKAPAPIFSPGGGTYASAQSVTVSSTAGALIHYTTDGRDPTLDDPLIVSGQSVLIVRSCVLKARAWKDEWIPSDVKSAVYTLYFGKLPDPDFSPDGGTYTSVQNVTISCATPGAVVHYTTNGLDPTESDPVVSGPVLVDASMTLKARAYKADWTPSDVKTAVYTITGTVATPSFDPAAGTYSSAQNVAVSCATPGAVIHYTTNGIDPTETDPIVMGPIPVDTDVTLKARAYKTDWTPSAVKSATYTITGTVTTPTFDPDGGAYTSPQNVTISSTTPGAVIHYTTNGIDPTESDPVVSGPVLVDASMTLQARAYKADWTPSDVKTAVYTITGTVATPSFDPAAGTYSSAQNVAVSCATPGAAVRYTADGNDPTENDAIVTGPVFVDRDMTLKARAWKTGWTPSSVQSASYTITLMSSMKALPTNSTVTIPQAVVTALSPTPGRFYVEADDRSCGLLISKSGYTAVPGTRVTVQGKVGTFATGEKGVLATSITDAGTGSIVPLALTNRDVGGGDWRYNSTNGAGQKGVKDGPAAYSQALNNICMLITPTGRVTYSATGYFYIDDGCRLADNSGHIGIKVQGSVPPPIPTPPDWTPVGSYVTVTGISSCFKVGSDLYRQILATQVVLAQ